MKDNLTTAILELLKTYRTGLRKPELMAKTGATHNQQRNRLESLTREGVIVQLGGPSRFGRYCLTQNKAVAQADLDRMLLASAKKRKKQEAAKQARRRDAALEKEMVQDIRIVPASKAPTRIPKINSVWALAA